MSVENLQALIDERAENLAIVHLTRRPDLSIQRMKLDQGLDLFIEILANKTPTGQVFGIQIKAQETLLQADSPPPLLPSDSLKYAQTLPFPVCLFLFEMEGDRGFYTWLKAPMPRDPNQDWGEWRSLTPESLDEIINHITAWYSQRQQIAA